MTDEEHALVMETTELVARFAGRYGYLRCKMGEDHPDARETRALLHEALKVVEDMGSEA